MHALGIVGLLALVATGCGEVTTRTDGPGDGGSDSGTADSGCIIGAEGCPCGQDDTCDGQLLCDEDAICTEVGVGGDGDGDSDGAMGDGDGDGDGGGDGDGDGDDGRSFDAGTDPDRNRVTPAMICERLTTIQCAGEAYCCDDPGRTEQQCKDIMLDGCINELFLDEAASKPIVGFDADAAFTAFTEFERLASLCDPAIAGWGISPDGFAAISKGTRASGDNCFPTDPRDSGDVVAALQSCTDVATQSCLPDGLIWRCRPRGDVDAPCSWDANCVDGLFCDTDAGGRCRARRLDGEACAAANECASLACKGALCVPATSQSAFCLAE